MDAPFLAAGSLTVRWICSRIDPNENAGGKQMKDTYIARRKRLMADKGENTAVVIFSDNAL